MTIALIGYAVNISGGKSNQTLYGMTCVSRLVALALMAQSSSPAESRLASRPPSPVR